MNTSEQLNELFTALAKAQAEMPLASNNSDNPFFKSKYADMAQLVKSSRETLTSHGLCVSQRILVGVDSGNILSTLLGHTSGQWLESQVRIAPPKQDIQSFGSYVTYLKRYSYAAIIGIATDDDDGEAVMQSYRSGNQPSAQVECITADQLEQLESEIKGHPDIAQDMMEKMRISSLKQLPKSRFIGVIQRVREIKDLKK